MAKKELYYKPLEKRNRYISENRNKPFMECLDDYHGVFQWHDNFLISIFESFQLYSGRKEWNRPERIQVGDDLMTGDDIEFNILGDKLSFCFVEFLAPEEIKDVCKTEKWNSFFNLSRPGDMIIKYAYHHAPLMGLGYLLLVRKIKGRYEVMEKFRWYVS